MCAFSVTFALAGRLLLIDKEIDKEIDKGGAHMTLTRRSFIGAAAALLAGPTSRIYGFHNVKWFNGERFRRGDFYSVDGTLTFRRPRHLDESLDLSGKYVIPPLGEAHN